MTTPPTPQELEQIRAVFTLDEHPEVPGMIIPSRLLNGRFVDMWDLDGSACAPETVGNALSQINRYAGQTPFPYSVAQHSILCSGLGTFDLAYENLTHDLTEGCGLGDVVSPLKRKNPIIKVVEARMRAALAPHWAIRPVELPETKAVDELAYRLERWLLHGYPCPEGVPDSTLDYARQMIQECDYRKVRTLWLDLVYALCPRTSLSVN